MLSSTDGRRARRSDGVGGLKRLLAAVTTLLVVVSGMGAVGTTAANAALPTGISQAQIVIPGNDPATQVQDGDLLPQGQPLQLRVSYNVGAKGSTVDFKLGSNANLSDITGFNNDAIESATLVGTDTIRIVFKGEDDWPEGRTAGVFRLDFEVADDAGPGTTPIVWTIDTETVSVEIDIIDPNPPVPPVTVTEGYDKSVSPTNLNNYATYEQDGSNNWRFKDLDASIEDQVITYTLRVDVPNGVSNASIPVADLLPAGMQYFDAAGDPIAAGGTVPVTVGGQQWDADGLNETVATGAFAPTVGTNGRSFSGSLTASGAAKLTLTYRVKITDKSQVETVLAANQPAAGGYGSFTAALLNTATFGNVPVAETATLNVNGTLAGPCPSCDGVFGKSTDWGSAQRNFVTDASGNIVEPQADIAYTLSAKLSTWSGVSPAQTLTRNVVISDTLPEHAEWRSGDAGFISLASGSSPDFTILTEATGTWTAATFAGDANVGKFYVDGRTLLINVGKHKDTDVAIQAKARLLKLAAPLVTNNDPGLRQMGTSTVVDATAYRFRNLATFTHGDGANGSVSKTADINPVKLPDERDNGINDSSAFTKSIKNDKVKVAPNGRADMEYVFDINTAKTAPADELELIDHIDDRFFELTEDTLVPPTVAISGSYPGVALVQADFDLSLNSDGDLVIHISDAGKAKLQGAAADGVLRINLTLQTRQLDGKETLDITNRATLNGINEQPEYWSENGSIATSYGAEIGLEKRVWDRQDAAWSRLLKTGTDADGQMVQNRYVYQIEFRSYDNFTDDALIDVVDQLAEEAGFVGFVTSDDPVDWGDPDAATAATLAKSGILGSYDAANRQVRLTKPQGVWYPAGATIAFRIMVEIEEGTKQVVNGLSWNGTPLPPTETVVQVIGQPGIDIEKWIDEGETPEYDQTGALLNDGLYAGDYDTGSKALETGKTHKIDFTISNDGPDRLLDIEVIDTLTSGVGAITDLVCTFPPVGTHTATTWSGPMEIGTQFTCEGTLPALKAGERHTDNVTVSGVGEVNGNTVRDSDLWSGHGKSYAVGDYVWIDKNKDGRQDADEPVLSGVEVELLDADGKVVATTKTDANGLYKFDDLEAGTYQVRFTLTEKQAEKYKYTTVNSGDAAGDSDAAVQRDPRVGLTKQFVLDDTNAALTTSYEHGYNATEGIDPTWDAGVIEKKYAVGDYVWIDSNRDGKQGKDETPLPGVTVELLNAKGEVVATTKTDKDGRYLFDDLDGGTYQVRFTLTDKQAKKYNFTKVGSGSSAKDSNARADEKNPAIGTSKKFRLGPENTALTHDYDRDFTASEGVDPTWDAGVVEIDADGIGGDGDELGDTGAPNGLWLPALGGLGLMLLGLGLMARRRARLS